MSYKDKFIAYLKHYTYKNIQKVADMFADDIALKD